MELIDTALERPRVVDGKNGKKAAAKSNGALSAMQGEQKGIQWEHSYVAGDKTFCVYLAEDDALIAEHAERSGFPASIVTRVANVIDPVTAER